MALIIQSFEIILMAVARSMTAHFIIDCTSATAAVTGIEQIAASTAFED